MVNERVCQVLSVFFCTGTGLPGTQNFPVGLACRSQQSSDHDPPPLPFGTHRLHVLFFYFFKDKNPVRDNCEMKVWICMCLASNCFAFHKMLHFAGGEFHTFLSFSLWLGFRSGSKIKNRFEVQKVRQKWSFLKNLLILARHCEHIILHLWTFLCVCISTHTPIPVIMTTFEFPQKSHTYCSHLRMSEYSCRRPVPYVSFYMCFWRMFVFTRKLLSFRFRQCSVCRGGVNH